MFIQCCGCGYTTMLDPRLDTAEELENEVHKTIESGWRYSPDYDDFACPECLKKYSQTRDKLHELYCGKIKASSKNNSYKQLMMRFAKEVQQYRDLNAEVYE